MIYEPAEDSYLIAEEVRKRAKEKMVLDVGSGSGILMEAALEAGAKSVKGVDIDLESVEFCEERSLDVVESDLFKNISGKFDLIVFNPPYLPLDDREDEESGRITSGGVKGDEIIVRFLGEVGDYLEEGGEVLILVSSLTPLEEIGEILEAKRFFKKVVASEKFFMERLEVWEISMPLP